MSLAISLHSELSKIRRTSALYLCLLSGALLPVFLFLEVFDVKPNTPMGLPWNQYFQAGRGMLNFAVFNLYVILISTLLIQTEYRDKTWKQVLSSPQKLIHIFLAKYIVLQLLLLGFLIVYNCCFGLTAVATDLIEPRFYEGGFSLKAVLLAGSQTYLLALGLSTIQYCLALRFKNFIAPLAIGFFLWFLSPVLLFALKSSFGEMYPYSFLMLSELPKYRPNIWLYQWYSLAIAALVFAVGFWQFNRKKIKW